MSSSRSRDAQRGEAIDITPEDDFELRLRETLEEVRALREMVLEELMGISSEWPRQWWRLGKKRRVRQRWSVWKAHFEKLSGLHDQTCEMLYALGATQIPPP